MLSILFRVGLLKASTHSLTRALEQVTTGHRRRVRVHHLPTSNQGRLRTQEGRSLGSSPLMELRRRCPTRLLSLLLDQQAPVDSTPRSPPSSKPRSWLDLHQIPVEHEDLDLHLALPARQQ